VLLTITSAITLSAVMLAICVLAHAFDNRVARFTAAASFEIAFVCGLFALWQIANRMTRGHTSGGLARGRAVYHWERVIHLPTERSAQQLIIGHHTIVRAANYYYDTAHLTLMVVFLVWLWLRHRDRYPFIRNMIAVFTGISLLIQMVAVAPPRLIGGTGLIDTAAVYGQSVYSTAASNIADQYAAMPSIHVGWAMLISYAIVTVNKSRWRWLGVLYGPLTFFVVVATANHYWLDGVAACALLVVAWFAAKGIERLQARRSLPVRDVEPAPQIQQGAFS
jgi:PAP2 superfamily